MNLTNEQLEAAEKGETVRVRANHVELVLLRADVYETLTAASESPRATYPAVFKVVDQDDDPDQYLEYLDGPR